MMLWRSRKRRLLIFWGQTWANSPMEKICLIIRASSKRVLGAFEVVMLLSLRGESSSPLKIFSLSSSSIFCNQKRSINHVFDHGDHVLALTSIIGAAHASTRFKYFLTFPSPASICETTVAMSTAWGINSGGITNLERTFHKDLSCVRLN